MSIENKYDDLASVYFLIALIVIFLIPSSISYFKKWRRFMTVKHMGKCECQGCQTKSKKILEKEREISFSSVLKFSFYLVLWVALIRLMQVVATTEQAPVENLFDPYQILNLDSGATKEEIRKSYRSLSLKYHPDKYKEEDAETRYIAIQKAYETLTDDAVRERWEKYGNPDGPQGFSMGLALPSFLVQSSNKFFVLGFYFILIVIVPVVIVVYFKKKQAEVGSNQVMIKTAQIYHQLIEINWTARKLADAFCAAEEYRLAIKIRASDDENLKKLKEKFPFVEPKPKANDKKGVFPPYVVKNKALLYAHFSRLHDRMSPALQADLRILLKKAPLLVLALFEGCKGYTVPMFESIYLSQMIIQGVWHPAAHKEANTTVCQLPHVTNDMVAKFAKKKILSVRQFDNLKGEVAEEFNTKQMTDIDAVLKQMPLDLKVTFFVGIQDKEEFSNQDEEIPGGSILTLTMTVSRPNQPSIKFPNRQSESKSANPVFNRSKQDEEDEPVEVHAPLLSEPKNEVWWLILSALPNVPRVVAVPKKITSLRDGAQFHVPFQAPHKKGIYHITANLMCDSYVGFDVHEILRIRVSKDMETHHHEEKRKYDSEEEDEEDEPLEDDSESD